MLSVGASSHGPSVSHHPPRHLQQPQSRSGSDEHANELSLPLAPAQPTKANNCRRFYPNVFTPSKCQECFRSKAAHSAEALAENRAARKVCKCGYLFVAPLDYDYNNAAHRSRRWQQRWFVLYDDGELTFAVDSNADTVAQGVIDMTRVTEVRDGSELSGHECSLLLRAPDHDYFLKATTKDEIRWWYDVLVMYPRSLRFTKQQRAQNQRRSRTLPNNALNDQQLKALRNEPEQPAVKPVEPVSLPVRSAMAPPPKPYRDPSRRTSQPPGTVADSLLPSLEDPMKKALPHPEAAAGGVLDVRRKEVQREIRQSALDYLESLKERNVSIPGGPVNQNIRTEINPNVVKKTENFPVVVDSFTDTDLSTDSEEVAHPAPTNPPPSAALPTTPVTPTRFPFTGLSTQDMEDLKQLQRIMSKKSTSTGSVSSRSSSSSSAYASYKAPQPRTPTVAETGRPRSPPVNRGALSKAKERSRVRPRSKSPPPPPVTGGRAGDGGHAEVRIKSLREEYLGEMRGNAGGKSGKPDALRSASLSFSAAPEPIYSIPRGKRQSADQSTQISLDIRHYETMLANLEKRLLDREQLLREANSKVEAMRSEQNGVVQEKNKMVSGLQEQVERVKRDAGNLLSSLEMSRTLNDKYEKRLGFLLEEMNRCQKDYQELHEAKTTSEHTLHSRITDLESDLAALRHSQSEASHAAETLLQSNRHETNTLRQKLNETQSLLMTALQRDLTEDETAALMKGEGEGAREVGWKLLRALQEIKALRKENVALNDQIGEMNSEFADVRERLEGLQRERDNMDYSDACVSTSDLDTTPLHADCHATVDALHQEISSLQSRLASQSRLHQSELSKRDETLSQISAELSALLVPQPPGDGHYRDQLDEMKRIYAKSVAVMEREKDEELEEVKRKYEEEVRRVEARKERELEDEVTATKAALEAVRKSYREELDRERERLIAFYTREGVMGGRTENGASVSVKELAEEMEKLRQELESAGAWREECERFRTTQNQLHSALQRCQARLHSTPSNHAP